MYYTNRKLFCGLAAVVLMLATSAGYCLDAQEVIQNSKKAMSSLSSVKSKGQTVTGGVDITDEETVIDYSKGMYYGIDKKDQKALTSTYSENGITYINEMFTGAWFRFGPDLGLSINMFDKETLFNLFPDNVSGTGFNVTFAGNEKIGNTPCYRIQSNVFNPELVKLYIQRSLEKFVPQRIAAGLKSSPKMLDDYLNAYTQNLQTTLWIAQDNFLVKKMQTTYNQTVGPGQSVSVRRDIEYYDFNKAVRIKIPEEARQAKNVSLQDLGFQ